MPCRFCGGPGGDGHLFGECTFPHLVKIHGNPEFHYLMRMYKGIISPGVCFLTCWHLWIGKSGHPGPSPLGIAVEVFSVGCCVTHGDYAMEEYVGVIAVVEHRLMQKRVRHEYARLNQSQRYLFGRNASFQASSHVGNAGVGVVRVKCAPLLLRTIATAQVRNICDMGRAVRCLLFIGGKRCMDLPLIHGFQVSDGDAVQLGLTDQSVDAVLGELAVVARGQPMVMSGNFDVEPTEIPCLSKGISAGLWVDLEGAWAGVSGVAPSHYLQALLELCWWQSAGLHGWVYPRCNCCSYLLCYSAASGG